MTDHLEVENCEKRYGAMLAVRNLSLQVAQGERFGLLGRSGSGKTTLLRLICGLETLQQGKIAISDKIVSTPSQQLPPEQRKIGMVFQSLGLWPHLSVASHLDLVLRKDMPDRKQREKEIDSLLALTSLQDKEHRRPAELSGGEQQRLALARALAQHPRLLLLDEPFAHVDEPLRDELCENLLEILNASEMTSILVSHDAPHLAAICHRVGLMNNGSIIQQGTFQELYDHPISTEAAQMTGTVFLVSGRSDGRFVQTSMGPLQHRNTPPPVDGLLCLRPESFILSTNEDKPGQLEARINRSQFIAGRWRVYFQLAKEEFWTWQNEPIEAGKELALQITPAHFIPSDRESYTR